VGTKGLPISPGWIHQPGLLDLKNTKEIDKKIKN
jgi:hypothetical protein